jgi:hypothetical protein
MEKPTVPGWYWFRGSQNDTRPWMVRVQKLGFGLMQMYLVGCDEPIIIGDGGEWVGPIFPPEEAQP